MFDDSMEAMAAAFVIDDSDPGRLSAEEIRNSYGSVTNFMYAFRLKPYNMSDLDEAISISRSFKEADDDDDEDDEDEVPQLVDDSSYEYSDGDYDEFTCDDAEIATLVDSIAVPVYKKRVLVILDSACGGEAMVDHDDMSYAKKKLITALDSKDGMDRDFIVNISSKSLMSCLCKNVYSCCIILGVGSSGEQGSSRQLYNPRVQTYLKQWVAKGGRLLVQGEGKHAEFVLNWFNIPPMPAYKYCAYERIHGKVNTKHNRTVPRSVMKRIVKVPYTKCVTFFSPSKHAVVYDRDQGLRGPTVPASISFGNYMNGSYGFLGDVNGIEETIANLVTLASF